MIMKKSLAVVSAAAVAFGLAACGSGSDSAGSGDGIILTNGTEPQNPLLPANTNEVGGGRVVDMIYAGLVYYDTEGKVHNEMAEKIEKVDASNYKITLKADQKFSDGTPVKAENFVKAWNYAMENSQQSASFFEPIKGYQEGAKEMEGLKVVDDKTFTIELAYPISDFELRLGYSAFFPLPDSAFADMSNQGEKPVSNGPYKLETWEHNGSITIVPNENYAGDREAKNDGVKFTFYPKLDAGYADLLADNLDVLDAIPDAAFAQYQSELQGRFVNEPTAVFQSFTIPEKLEHFSGEEGKLRRQAISHAINREEITDKIFQGTRTPATDFTSPVIDGHSEAVPGNEVLKYDPAKAKDLWAKADAISPWTGEFAIAYNSDGGHQAWVDATANSIKNTLGINAVGAPYPDFKSMRDDVKTRTIATAFRTGWQADYPGLDNFLTPLYTTKASANDGDYSNPEVDRLLKEAQAAGSVDEANAKYNQVQEILFKDMPSVPLWYANVTAGYGTKVDNVKFTWKEVPAYYAITKK
ncbi:Oligopeptide-binding protein OppA precursor [Corynebacterium kalinowskii]|uniref:Oligopeptide-binding protein OppA n=1 Tax=Corynebacterium kalinowskii TaxID=2675216 RepID=A0A6B8W4U8_9CORY|nr:ABC transporter substrate-binding protein [Corynebacterium kalinowskii]QGU02418.1 Oligopeptide-binding protein OppA precursor [Corynebacterium kalinowskii]